MQDDRISIYDETFVTPMRDPRWRRIIIHGPISSRPTPRIIRHGRARAWPRRIRKASPAKPDYQRLHARRAVPSGPSGRGRRVIAIISIALTGIIVSAVMAIIFIAITVDVTSGTDRTNPLKTGRTEIFPITVTKVFINLHLRMTRSCGVVRSSFTKTTPRASASSSIIYRVWRGVVSDPVLG